MCPFSVESSMSFDKRLHPCNHHGQGPKGPLCSFQSVLTSTPGQPLMGLPSLWISLPELHANRLINIHLNMAFTLHHASEAHPRLYQYLIPFPC